MPSKESYLIYFLVITGLLILMQVFVYNWLSYLIRTDFPVRSRKWLRIVKLVFAAMNIPLLVIFFRRQIPVEMANFIRVMFFSFTIWQGLILVWSIILIPVSIGFLIKKLFRNQPTSLPVEH